MGNLIIPIQGLDYISAEIGEQSLSFVLKTLPKNDEDSFSRPVEIAVIPQAPQVQEPQMQPEPEPRAPSPIQPEPQAPPVQETQAPPVQEPQEQPVQEPQAPPVQEPRVQPAQEPQEPPAQEPQAPPTQEPQAQPDLLSAPLEDLEEEPFGANAIKDGVLENIKIDSIQTSSGDVVELSSSFADKLLNPPADIQAKNKRERDEDKSGQDTQDDQAVFVSKEEESKTVVDTRPRGKIIRSIFTFHSLERMKFFGLDFYLFHSLISKSFVGDQFIYESNSMETRSISSDYFLTLDWHIYRQDSAKYIPISEDLVTLEEGRRYAMEIHINANDIQEGDLEHQFYIFMCGYSQLFSCPSFELIRSNFDLPTILTRRSITSIRNALEEIEAGSLITGGKLKFSHKQVLLSDYFDIAYFNAGQYSIDYQDKLIPLSVYSSALYNTSLCKKKEKLPKWNLVPFNASWLESRTRISTFLAISSVRVVLVNNFFKEKNKRELGKKVVSYLQKFISTFNRNIRVVEWIYKDDHHRFKYRILAASRFYFPRNSIADSVHLKVGAQVQLRLVIRLFGFDFLREEFYYFLRSFFYVLCAIGFGASVVVVVPPSGQGDFPHACIVKGENDNVLDLKCGLLQREVFDIKTKKCDIGFFSNCPVSGFVNIHHKGVIEDLTESEEKKFTKNVSLRYPLENSDEKMSDIDVINLYFIVRRYKDLNYENKDIENERFEGIVYLINPFKHKNYDVDELTSEYDYALPVIGRVADQLMLFKSSSPIFAAHQNSWKQFVSDNIDYYINDYEIRVI